MNTYTFTDLATKQTTTILAENEATAKQIFRIGTPRVGDVVTAYTPHDNKYLISTGIITANKGSHWTVNVTRGYCTGFESDF